MMDTKTCRCGKPGYYEYECRDCYENRIRLEVRDTHAYYDIESITQRISRTKMREVGHESK